MGLINCPECKKEVSDKATICIHCGYPLSEYKTVEELYFISIDMNKNKHKYLEFMEIFRERFHIQGKETLKIVDDNIPFFTNLSFDDAQKIQDIFKRRKLNVDIVKHEQIIGEANSFEKYATSPKPTCPKCGSTSTTTGARGVDGFWGFLGAGRTVNRCANCGHSWEPKG